MHVFDRILNLLFAIKIHEKTVINYEFPSFQCLLYEIMQIAYIWLRIVYIDVFK